MKLENRGPLSVLLLASVAIGCGSNQPASHWSGKTYLLNIASNHWTKPDPQVGGEIAPFVPQFLFAIAGSSANLTATVATATGGVQNMCNPTQQATFSESQYPDSQIVLTDFSNMLFQELNDTVTPNQTITLRSTLRALTFANVLPGDSARNEGTFNVTVDVGELYPLFIRIQPQPATVQSVCNALGAVSGSCQACAFNPSSASCLTLGAVQLEATSTDSTVKQISMTDIASTCP